MLLSVTWPGSWGRHGGLGFSTRSLVLGEQLSGSVQSTRHPFALISRPQGLLDRDFFPLINRKEKGLADRPHFTCLHVQGPAAPPGNSPQRGNPNLHQVGPRAPLLPPQGLPVRAHMVTPSSRLIGFHLLVCTPLTPTGNEPGGLQL